MNESFGTVKITIGDTQMKIEEVPGGYAVHYPSNGAPIIQVFGETAAIEPETPCDHRPMMALIASELARQFTTIRNRNP